MAYLLVALTLFQFVFRVVGLQNSALYIAVNPYVLSLPFIIFWLGAAITGKQKTHRNLLIAWIALLIFPCVMLRDFTGDAGFFFLFLRGLQFFWGPLLIVPAFLGFFRLAGFVDPTDDTIRRYITIMGAIAGSLTLFELFAVHILGIAPLTFPWIGNPEDAHPIDLNPFRPWGLPSYPQPNALIMAYLFWLALVWQTRGKYHKLSTLAGVALSGSGTGQLGFAALTPLVIRKPLVVAAAILTPLSLLVTWATLTNQYAVSGGGIGRFDLAYAVRLSAFFTILGKRFFHQFNNEEIVFGTQHPTAAVVVGYTHDWAYLDIFYAYGLVGLVGYVLLFGGLLFLAIPSRISSARRFYFAAAGLILNFHYGTLNFFAGQFLLSSIVALRLNGIYSREVQSTTDGKSALG
jgi:hypothetical protein